MISDNTRLVALIGRPNVGKSTLFNRMTRSRDALVDPEPGVTRDRHYARVAWNDRTFVLVDTGGIDDAEGDAITGHIRQHALQAVDEADIILFVLDGRQGLMPGDGEIVDLLRRTDKQVFFIVNKIDGPDREAEFLAPFWELGVATLWPLSAEHGYGFRSLMDGIAGHVPDHEEEDDLPEGTIRLAFLGRPNVGKSSMVNTIMGQERMMVSEMAGTTRDSVDTLLTHGEYSYLLIDTAGIRRKGKTTGKLEKFSVLKSLGALARCHIALVLIDAGEGITDQDVRILGYTQEQGRACIILVNKWDLLAGDSKRQKQLLEEIAMAAGFMSFAPVLKVSALTGQGIKLIFPETGRVFRQYNQRFQTSALNRLLEEAVARHAPPYHRGRRLKFYYTAQLGTAPPTFAVIANDPRGIHFSYQRYLVNQFREGLGLDRVPVRIFFREKSKRKGKKK
jgi:GTP-binding protein